MSNRTRPAAPSPLYLARHAETVFNRARRMQGNDAHTPLTRDGIAQAEAMGEAFRRHFTSAGIAPPTLWASPAGRTLQTAAIVAEHLGLEFFDIRQDARLREIEVGRWTGRDYAQIIEEEGEILDMEHKLFRMPIPEGEHYTDIATRLLSWLEDAGPAPALVISHGMTARVLRGLLVGGRAYEGVEIAVDLPQGSISRITAGAEETIHTGSGTSGPRAA